MAARWRKPIPPRTGRCDVFDLECSLQNANLVVRVGTDLPPKTRLHLHITRPSRGYIWTVFKESLRVEPIDGALGIELIRSVEELDRNGLNKYRHWKRGWPGRIEGVPDGILEIRIVLKTLDHQFGACNRDLAGSQVQVQRNGHWIERQASQVAAIPAWLPDKLP